jgi:hypothetical protein
MNAVLNKKFGTSTTYDPAGWPDDVNLLGKLPEKTVSGSIAHITDGADEVPIKSWEVEIAPTLTGKSAIECNASNVNLLYSYGATGSAYGMTRTVISDSGGGVRLSGVPTWGTGNTTQFRLATVPAELKSRLSSYASVKAFCDSPYCTPNSAFFDTSLNYITVSCSTVATTENVTIDIYLMVYVGTAPTEFTPYNGTTSTVNLGRTIYGGTADVVKGEGTDENGNDFTFTPITPTPETALGVNNFWADEGDTEVTYRADINLALGGQ